MSDTKPSTQRTAPAYKAEDLLTRKEAAAVVGISLSRLAQLRRAGEIAYAARNHHTGAVRYRYADCVTLRDKREVMIAQWTP